MIKRNCCDICNTTLATGGKRWSELSDRTKLKPKEFHFPCWKLWRAAGFPDLEEFAGATQQRKAF